MSHDSIIPIAVELARSALGVDSRTFTIDRVSRLRDALPAGHAQRDELQALLHPYESIGEPGQTPPPGWSGVPSPWTPQRFGLPADVRFTVVMDGRRGGQPLSFDKAMQFLDSCGLIENEAQVTLVMHGVPFGMDGVFIAFEACKAGARG